MRWTITYISDNKNDSSVIRAALSGNLQSVTRRAELMRLKAMANETVPLALELVAEQLLHDDGLSLAS